PREQKSPQSTTLVGEPPVNRHPRRHEAGTRLADPGPILTMISTLVRAVRPIVRVVGLMAAAAGRIAWLLVRGRIHDAAEETRLILIVAHDDCATLLALVQRALGRHRRLRGRELDRILIVKLDRIGDMVNTTPVFDALRARFPHA